VKRMRLLILTCTVILSGCGFMGLPNCESNAAKKTLMEAFNQAQFARQMSLSAIEITDARTTSGSNERLRRCTAIIALNNLERVAVKYTLAPRDDGRFMLEFEIM